MTGPDKWTGCGITEVNDGFCQNNFSKEVWPKPAVGLGVNGHMAISA